MKKKYILEYLLTDDFTYFFNSSIPFEYESKEKFLYDFMSLILDSVKNSQYVFKFKNKEFNILNFGYLKLDGDIKSFEYIEPNVYELEEWFHKNKIDIES
jgi:hypothetical protein